jgi:hypothetical protein
MIATSDLSARGFTFIQAAGDEGARPLHSDEARTPGMSTVRARSASSFHHGFKDILSLSRPLRRRYFLVFNQSAMQITLSALWLSALQYPLIGKLRHRTTLTPRHSLRRQIL